MRSCFDTAPEFIDLDNRRLRRHIPISSEQMHNKHEAMFPKSLIEGKSVLDLGCCLGATGHWCLSARAKEYTGVEVQKEYADTARSLLTKHHPGKVTIDTSSIEEWLDGNSRHFDIVSMLGVINVFTDYYSVLKKITAIADEAIIIESVYHDRNLLGDDFSGVQFTERQHVNLANEDASLVGRGSRISPRGLEFIMREFGFVSNEGLLKSAPITGARDVYNLSPETGAPARFLMRFTRTESHPVSLSRDLAQGRTGARASWHLWSAL